ncbi:MAG: hypothetical protein Greene07147_521 [Parcubacteria group bacterium Greene0714_7]|nr:MAG: hypothetical protein Greene07147_521 [Parcubacteria group bacterium Greene0714_7]
MSVEALQRGIAVVKLLEKRIFSPEGLSPQSKSLGGNLLDFIGAQLSDVERESLFSFSKRTGKQARKKRGDTM